jgi:hypothetical protein
MSKRSLKKSKRRSKAIVPALGITGLSLSLASGATASTGEARRIYRRPHSLLDSSLARRNSRTSACRRSTPSTRKMPHNLSSARKSLSGAAVDAADAAAVAVDAAGEAAEAAAAAEAAVGPGAAVGFVKPNSSGLIEFDCSKAFRQSGSLAIFAAICVSHFVFRLAEDVTGLQKSS